MVSVGSVAVERVVGVPVAAAARVVAVVIVAVAFMADVWLISGSSSTLRGPVLLGQVVLASSSLAAVLRPAWVVVLGVVAMAVSLWLTAAFWLVEYQFSFFTDLAALPLVVAVLLLRGGRRAGAVALGVALTGLVVGLRSPETSIRLILSMSLMIGVALAAMAVVYVRLTERERRTSVEFARQAERLEMAREIHDVVGHHVTGMIVLAQAQQFVERSRAGGGEVVAALQEIEAAGVETMRSVRRLVGMLRTDDTTPTSLVGDLAVLVDDLRSTHPHTEVAIDESLGDLPMSAEAAKTVHRVFREAVTNVRRHGDPGAAVEGSVRRVGRAVEIVVENTMTSGRSDGGFGLVGMRERVEMMGGTLSAAAIDSCRWRLRAAVPIEWSPTA